MTSDADRSAVLGIFERDLHAFVDGELDPRREEVLLAHLATDRRDRERLDSFRSQGRVLRELRDAMIEDAADQPPRRIDLALVAALETRSARARQTRVGAAIAAGLALLIAGGVTWRDLSPEPVVAEAPQFPFGGTLATSLGAFPAGDGGKPVSWLAGQMPGGGLRLPDLNTFGLKPVGGAVVESAAVPAIRLVWADETGNRLSLYAALVTSEAQQAFTLVPEGHVSMHWRSGDVVYALIAPTDSRRLLDVVRAVAENWTHEAPAISSAAADPVPRAEDKSVVVQPVVLPTGPAPALVTPDQSVPSASGKPTEKPKPL